MHLSPALHIVLDILWPPGFIMSYGPYTTAGYAKFFGKSRVRCASFTASSYHHYLSSIQNIGALIAGLGCISSPFAIPRFVVPVVINAVNRVPLRWARPHIFKESREAIPPSLTNSYASPAPIFVIVVARIGTPLPHMLPYDIFIRARSTMLPSAGNAALIVIATTRDYQSALKMRCQDFLNFAAVAYAYPCIMVFHMRRDWCSFAYNEPPEPSAGQDGAGAFGWHYTFSRLDSSCVRINSLIRSCVSELHLRPRRSSRTSVGSPMASVPNLLAERPVKRRHVSISGSIGSMKLGASMTLGYSLSHRRASRLFGRPVAYYELSRLPHADKHRLW